MEGILPSRETAIHRTLRSIADLALSGAQGLVHLLAGITRFIAAGRIRELDRSRFDVEEPEPALDEVVEGSGIDAGALRRELGGLGEDPHPHRLTRPGLSARRYIAWQSILAEKVTLDLTPHQVKQAETQLASADSTVATRLPETYQWLLVPEQGSPQAPIEWQAIRLSGQDALAARASRKLRSEELLVAGFAATRLRMELDRVPLWRSNRDVAVSQLVEDFARYPYLPRLKDPSVLLAAVREGVSLLTWEKDSFAHADSFDEAAGRYRGLRGGQQVSIVDADSAGLVVKPEIARSQMQQEAATAPSVAAAGGTGGATSGPGEAGSGATPPEPEQAAKVGPKRFHGSANLDAERVGRDAGRIAEEVISHLAGLVGSKVKVSLEIEAELPAGAPENVVRTVTENCRALKFTTHAFEKE